MLPTFRASLPYTLALAVLVYLSFAFLPVLGLGQEIFVVIGVLLAGILIPVLLDVKAGTTDPVLQTNKALDYQGETTTLYVGNLPYRANEDAVKELCQRFGIVINVLLSNSKVKRIDRQEIKDCVEQNSGKPTLNFMDWEYICAYQQAALYYTTDEDYALTICQEYFWEFYKDHGIDSEEKCRLDLENIGQ